MEAKIGEKTFVFERNIPSTNRFNIFEVVGGKRVFVGDGIFYVHGNGIWLRNIELREAYRGTLGAGLIKNTFRFFAETFPERKVLGYTKLIKGKPMRETRINLERLRARRQRK